MSGERPAARHVTVRPVRWGDTWWLLGRGLDPGKVGEQYHWAETPLQLVIAPARAVLGPRGPAVVVEVDGRRAGYVGRNPLSGNLEYFLDRWARGGVGARAVTQFLAGHRRGDRSRCFFVAHGNARSLATLHRAFERLGWVEGTDWWAEPGRFGTKVRVRAEP